MSALKKQVMTKILQRLRKEDGNVLLVAFIFLVILTLIGIFSTRTARMDMQIASNEIPYKRNFYIAEAGLYREAAELGRGNYPVTKTDQSEALVVNGAPAKASITIPAPAHVVMGQSYNFNVDYMGSFPPPKGYSPLTFARYDYSVDVTANNVRVDSRLYKIGPRAD